MKLHRLALSLVFAALASIPLFAADARKKLVMLIAEQEYETIKTLPPFAEDQLARDFRVVTVTGSHEVTPHAFDDKLKEVADADVLLVSVRRLIPTAAQLEIVRRHVAAGKPVVGIRTASHSFALRPNQKQVPGGAQWPEFDAEVLGGAYTNHHGAGPATTVTLAPGAKSDHPILREVTLPFDSKSSLYKNTPLQPGAQPLLIGTIPDKPAEPIAWTFQRKDGGRSFYTSLGSIDDFKNPAFVRLLRNGIAWAAAQAPAKK